MQKANPASKRLFLHWLPLHPDLCMEEFSTPPRGCITTRGEKEESVMQVYNPTVNRIARRCSKKPTNLFANTEDTLSRYAGKPPTSFSATMSWCLSGEFYLDEQGLPTPKRQRYLTCLSILLTGCRTQLPPGRSRPVKQLTRGPGLALCYYISGF